MRAWQMVKPGKKAKTKIPRSHRDVTMQILRQE
jgi:hypothetical protein